MMKNLQLKTIAMASSLVAGRRKVVAFYLIVKASSYLLYGKWAKGKQKRKPGGQVRRNCSNLPRNDGNLD